MSDLPEFVWADPPDIFDDMSIWYNYPTKGQTQYIRADAVQAQIDAAVKAERERCAKVAFGFGAVDMLTEHKPFAIAADIRKGDKP
jgi:hypothetical protein